ncbi:MAG TPA: ATP-dependent 6-phosphofructokinase [bacterium]|nr:ATP-dependent 6-phosphofructokinase [bacterium]HOL95125.1 ATP-dependent 6-phosphofructokinase [bacterium]HPP02824.1 ATP-dependent 6-phosphofructokinase [bacterium]HXK92954.1 ATP-dependent 6-phosphofructokinase [bacterium]
MKDSTLPDFTICRLGPPRYASPMQLSHIMGDLIANFVADEERILYDESLSSIRKYLERGIDPPAFEAAGPRDRIYFKPEDVTAAIVTCGGLCPGLNDVIQGIVQSLYFHYGVRRILGIRYGFKGLVENSGLEPIPLDPAAVNQIHTRGGTMLGSSRGPQPVEAMVDFMVRRGINLLFTIGGDGTQRGAMALVEEIQKRKLEIAVIGVPKTIDNDVLFVEKSFGFETAYSVATTVLLSAHAEAVGACNGIAIVKLMGRESGLLTATAAVASGEVNFTLVPEVPFDLDPPNGFLAALERRILKRHHALVVVAEGAGQDLITKGSAERERDASGNPKLADIGGFLQERVKTYFKDRGIEAVVRYIDPSYMVRSLQAFPSDRMYCLRMAHAAVHAAMSGRTGMLVGSWKSQLTHVPIEAVVTGRKSLDPESDLWLSVLESTGQPNRMVNP